MAGGAAATAPVGVAGREVEVATLHATLGGLADRSALVVVVGEPGIGKSALWTHAVADARGLGATVLTTRPAAAEASTAWSGLTDLLEGVPDAVLDTLAPPQRRALDAVGLRADPAGGVLEPRAVWTAFRSAVVALAVTGPVLVAVDDLHWLDGASVRTLAFLARRLPPGGVGVLATLRSRLREGGVHEILEVPGLERIDLGPLDPDGTATAVRAHVGGSRSRPQLDRIHAAAAGNPMMAIELARAGQGPAGHPPSVPASLDQLVGHRVSALTDAGRTTLAAVAAAARPTTVLLEAAGLAEGLTEVERAGVARVDRLHVRLEHPLFGAAAYGGCSSAVRRSVHARLAAVVDGDEERARHAALGVDVPGPEILVALDAAAVAAGRRGAPDSAAELAVLALDLTAEDDPARLRRHLAAGEHRFRSGDGRRARVHFARVLADATDRAVRFRAAVRLSELAWEEESGEAAVLHAREAVRLAGDQRRDRAEAEAALARALGVVDLEESSAAATRALALLDPDTADPALLAGVLLAGAEADFELGRGLDRVRFQQAIALERAAPHPRIADRADAALASLLRFDDDLDGARDALASLRKAVDEEGDESSLPFVLSHGVQGELWAGRWDDAEAAAQEHLELAVRTGQGSQRRQAEYNLALVAAHRGDDDRVGALAGPLAAAARAEGDEWSEMLAENVLGFAALGRSDHEAAVAHLDVGYAVAERMALVDPGRTRLRTDHVESLLAIGDRARAAELLDQYEDRARVVDRASALAAVARCRALAAAADGDEAAAAAAVTEAQAQHARAPSGAFAFDRARTLLVAGRLHRRGRRKRAARVALTEAQEAFVALGARRFAEQAGAELDRLGLRPAAPDGLTPTEQRVAELAARGLTTRQVADAAFLSPKTVEANLTRIYRKLGVGSRAELGAWFARHG
ncbi:MAG TPA: AAA family ATPase [Iamia sp.]|jgi:DNA-binding CsgD family transcriptional regulator|nr:AAA family ATPase [Iamia sp.]